MADNFCIFFDAMMENTFKSYIHNSGYTWTAPPLRVCRNFGDDIQNKVLTFAFGLSAEIERNLISQRTKEGLPKKKSKASDVPLVEETNDRQFIFSKITLKGNLLTGLSTH